jgi:hypothetical protein
MQPKWIIFKKLTGEAVNYYSFFKAYSLKPGYFLTKKSSEMPTAVFQTNTPVDSLFNIR